MDWTRAAGMRFCPAQCRIFRGRKDYSYEAIAAVGEVILHGIAIRPGKPAVLERRSETRRWCRWWACRYPVSAILVMEELVRPALNLLLAKPEPVRQKAQAVVSRRLTSSLKYLEFIRARVGKVEDKLVAVPLNRGAGVVGSFVKADGIVEVQQNKEGYEAGELVPVQLLRDMKEIENTLVITESRPLDR